MQLRFRWEADLDVWKQIPQPQKNRCGELLSQLLRTVAAADQRERSESDEQQD
jgi:hypothetical protein